MKETVTINYMDIELVVTGYYEAATNAIQYDADFLGYPGDPAAFEADEVYVSDSNILYSILIQLHFMIRIG